MTLAEVLAAAAALAPEERRRLVAALQALDAGPVAPSPTRRPYDLDDEEPAELSPYGGRW